MPRDEIGQLTAVSASNVAGDPSQRLLAFDLLDLQQYTNEKAYRPQQAKIFICSMSGATMSTTSSSTYFPV